MARYSEERKEAVLSKLLPPYNLTVAELARQEGISDVSLDIEFKDNSAPSTSAIKEYYCDVASKESVEEAFSKAQATLGGLDVLVNVAGVERGGPSESISDEEWDFLFDVNVKGVKNTNQSAFKYLKGKGGKIINFGSHSGILGFPKQAAYSAAKGAVHVWTRAVAQEWATHNITVNAVAPAMWTRMYQGFCDRLSDNERREFDDYMKSRIPLRGKPGDPQKDLAPVLVFLASSASDYMTGQTISVDGGWMMVR